ncbi:MULTISPECIES: porin [unclassified Bradyrhizobium]|uniref:porin n=1 Tax=unclassified Bradyrhizobium TaxID=2631580 RepID=UPI00247A0A40|nr:MULTISPECIES: porin [unclassified Bradyrhizobium]WGR75143.1 porin [Bradyrhizobium sp. ISRA426]WGR82646.1 porin [Bradyrhizobium sp. ISRA430]WGR90343.1 porin [Bradyrhizobium sp. ISRA432]
MRALLIILMGVGAASAAAAETLRLPAAERPQAGKALPLKGAAGAAKPNSCASYGRGFVMVDGTGTCVKIGGAISVDTTIRR